MNTETHKNTDDEPLWTLEDQRKAAGGLGFKSIKQKKQAMKQIADLEAVVEQLKKKVALLQDDDLNSIMEITLVENGLMDKVNKRFNGAFVRSDTYRKESSKKDEYYQLWQESLKENENLKQQISQLKGVKQLSENEKW